MSLSDPDQKRKKAHRSPAYPSMGLRTAIEYARTIYGHERKSPAPVAVVAGHCNTDIKSSKGLRLIAALKQYGLAIEEGSGDDREVRLSPLALDIIQTVEGSDEQLATIKRAAMMPAIHKKIFDEFGDQLPSNATLRSHLVRKLDFNESYVDKFIKQFHASLAFAKIGESDILDNADSNDEPDDTDVDHDQQKAKPVTAVAPPHVENVVVRDFPIPLLSGGLAVVRVPVPMSESDFEQITGTLNAWKAALVRKPKYSSALARAIKRGAEKTEEDMEMDELDESPE